MESLLRLTLVLALLLINAGGAHAAGGHFDVDDAYVLDADRCQLETWLTRIPRAEATAVHLGPSCRAGPVEVGFNVDRVTGGNGGSTNLGVQVKWATTVPTSKGVSAALVFALGLDSSSDRFSGTLYGPVSWRVTESVWLHGNAGVDHASGATSARYGASVEWAPADRLALIAERLSIQRGWTSRLGVRWIPGSSYSIDASVARLASQRSNAFTLGLNVEFGR